MAELQAAQQEALATYEKGLGSTGSSTPPALEQLPVQPINFIQIDGSPPEQELPALPASIFASVPETIFGQLPPPPPPPPTLNAVSGPTEIDTTVFDLFTATSGTFLASSPNSGATLTFGINGGTAGSTVIDGVTYDVSKAGPYGTLYVDSTTGAYTFVPDSDAINALIAPTTTDFTITVSDGTLSANQTFTIAINGTNDAAIISGDHSWHGYRGQRRRQYRARHAERHRHAHQHRRRRCAQYFHGGQFADRERARLRHVHDDGEWRVGLHHRPGQQRGAGTQCRRHTDRHLHGDHHRRHRTGGDGHHQRRQRRGGHFRRHDRLGDRGQWPPSATSRQRPARSPIPTSTIRRTALRRSVARRPATAAMAPSR